MRNFFCLVFLTVALLGCNGNNSPIDAIDGGYVTTTAQYKVLAGVDADLLSLDVYSPGDTTVKKPVVIWVHGGGWSIGDKQGQLDNKVALFMGLDYVLVSLNYRLSPFPYELDNPDRVMFPTHNEDVADAIRWVYDHISTYGGNPEKLVLLGHSAGAHLVALTGTNSTFLANVGLGFSAIKGVAAFDTEGYDVLGQVQEGNNLYINAFGTDMEANRVASPIHHAEQGAQYPKFFIAKRGGAARLAIANAFIEALEGAGGTVSQIDGSQYSHSGINEAIGNAGELTVTPPLLAFMAACFE